MDQMELLAHHRKAIQTFNSFEFRMLSEAKGLASKREVELEDAEQNARNAREHADTIASSARQPLAAARHQLQEAMIPFASYSSPLQPSALVAPEQFQAETPYQSLELADRSVQEHGRHFRNALASYLRAQSDEAERRRQAIRPGRIWLSVVVGVVALIVLIFLSNVFTTNTTQSAFGVFLIMVAVISYILAGVFLMRSENRNEFGQFQNYTKAVGGAMFIVPFLVFAPCIGPLIIFPLLYFWFVGLRVCYERYQAWLNGTGSLFGEL